MTDLAQFVHSTVSQLSTGYTMSEDIKLSDEGFNVSQIDVKFNNAIENITSPKVLSLLSYKLVLHDLGSQVPFRYPDYSKHPNLEQLNIDEAKRVFTNKWDSMLTLNSTNPYEKQLVDLLEAYNYHPSAIKKTLYVGRQQRTDYIDIIFRSENPELSAFVVNTLCKEFQHYFEAFRRERAMESMVSLDSLVKRRKDELDARILAKSQYINDSVANLDPGNSGVNKLSQIGQYENLLVEEQGRVQDLTYQINYLDAQINNIGGSASTTTPNTNPQTNTSNSELLVLRRQYTDLFDEYTRKGSNDPELKKRLDDLQQRMKLLASATPTTPAGAESPGGDRKSVLMQSKVNAEGLLRSSSLKINFYKSKIAELRRAIDTASPRASARLDQMDKEIEVATLEYTSAKERLNLASNMEGIPNNFKQTLYGQSAIEPEPSQRILIMGLSGLSAFLLSSVVFIFLAYIDQSIKTPSQFNRHTGLNLLGVVNLINMKRTNLKDQVTHIEEEHGKRDNPFRELLRKLRFEIERSNKRIILFTSTEPQQGKTTLVQALAFSLSLGKKKVIILDTNFCNNDLTALNNALPTLEQFSGNGQLDPAKFESLITETGVENVDIIGCKGGDYTPSEILPKNHLLNYLPDILKKYDYVFMEGAPLNGFTDTKELVHYADGVIAIFSATIEVKQSDKESIKFLHELNGKFIGAVLNKVEESDISL